VPSLEAPELHIRTDSGIVRVTPPTTTTIGRGADCDVVVADLRVSRRHLTVVYAQGDGWVVTDPGSVAGTFRGVERATRFVVESRLTLRLGDAESGPVVEFSVVTPMPTEDAAALSAVTVGRGADNDIVLPELFVSRHHADLRQVTTETWEVRDLGSHDGTYVDGRRVTSEIVTVGQDVVIGRSWLRATRGGWQVISRTGRPVLEAVGVSAILPSGQKILDDVSFSLDEGRLMAVVGTTGSGKSTLLKTLTGFRPPEVGEILVNGMNLYDDFAQLGRRIGYVPQDDILHPQLTMRRALDYAAELRFPADVNREERRHRVDEVMDELGLSDRANVPIERLSGGQRKRTSVAMELLTKPALLLLDEPTSGLDPGYEKAVMDLLRQLADGGRVVVVVTHSVQSLDLCDEVLFLAPGGRTAFSGPPAGALEFFDQSQYASVFQELETASPDRWAGGRQRRPSTRTIDSRWHDAMAGDAQGAPASPVAWWSQASTLSRRHLAILAADRRNLAYLAAEVLIPALLILALVGKSSFAPTPDTGARAARTLLGALAVSAAAVGAANSVREVVKELPVYYRERAVGLSRSAYLVSKAAVLGALTAIQVAILVFIATRGSGGPATSVWPGSPLLELIVDLALGGIAAMCLGLLISATVSSSEKAMALIPVVFIVMWLFSGMAVDLQSKPVMRILGYTTSANWSMSMAASSSSLYHIEDDALSLQSPPPVVATGQPAIPRDARWNPGMGNWMVGTIALIVLAAAALAAADWVLARKEPFARRSRRLNGGMKRRLLGALRPN